METLLASSSVRLRAILPRSCSRRVPTVRKRTLRHTPPPRRRNMSASADAAAVTAGVPAPSPPGSGGDNPPGGDVVVQYVVLRRDLIDSWPLGSVVTQGCHASVAAVWNYRHHPDVLAYCSDHNLDSMHKVTLEVKGETQLRNLSDKLKTGGIDHKLWVEQPEDFPTCLATRPYPKSQVGSFFKKLKLCK
ncbi:hypothetical protein C4D60_Mb01t11120 [Musa balbisiana]|uniref:peptidyl-tRNA hydrolase n=1 Tax=Musa balbisiana TaxID=52838 RepID=A0A4S8JNU4_MUSBA|nr:hypothetical protein C4D60_Mb01t11120 [Musa balbisiana]